MDQTVSHCGELQAEEYEVLKAIYPDILLDIPTFGIDSGAFKLELAVELGNETRIQVSSPDPGGTLQSSPIISVAFLPGIHLSISLPKTYPLQVPPIIEEVQAAWLTSRDGLKPLLLDMWKEGEPILYSWIEFIRSGEFLQRLDLFSPDDVIKLAHDSPDMLRLNLGAYDARQKSLSIRSGTHHCAICLSDRKGVQCIRLPCSHIFCKVCLSDYWSLSVREGTLGNIKCIDPDCKKDVPEDALQEVLQRPVFERWKWLSTKREFEKDLAHSYCPRCEGISEMIDDKLDELDAWLRFRQCTVCRFSFCKVCRTGWHGPATICPLDPAIVKRYVEGVESKEEEAWVRAQERRYSLWLLQHHVQLYQKKRPLPVGLPPKPQWDSLPDYEGWLNEAWLEKYTNCCPCGAFVQKISGCHHVLCTICGMAFSYKERPFDPEFYDQ